MEESRRELEEELETTDWSALFLLLLIAGTLLSFQALTIGRKQLCLALQGRAERAADLTPCVLRLRRITSALVVGALGFFLTVAQRSWASAAAGGDRAAFCSAGRNLWAAVLVFTASLIRLYDLNAVECQSQSIQPEVLEEETLPA